MIDRSKVYAVTDSKRAQFEACYRQQAEALPEFAVRLVPKVTITKTGEVSKAKVGSLALKSDRVEPCILQVIRETRFPEPQGGGVAIVTYPLAFISKE